MLHAVLFVTRYLPLVVAAIQLVENFVKPGTSGEQKKALVTRFVLEALAKLRVDVTPRTREIVALVVDITVSVLNAFGFFKSSSGPDAAAVAVANETASLMNASDARLNELELSFK
jgi:hypothetical protein